MHGHAWEKVIKRCVLYTICQNSKEMEEFLTEAQFTYSKARNKLINTLLFNMQCKKGENTQNDLSGIVTKFNCTFCTHQKQMLYVLKRTGIRIFISCSLNFVQVLILSLIFSLVNAHFI